MAEKSAEGTPSATTPNEGSGNWWDSWLSSAKTKSAEVFTMVRKDLDEIGSAVKSEATHVFNSTSTAIGKTLKLDEPESPANVMKKSLSTFIGQVSTALNPQLDDEDDTEVILSSGDTTMLSTYKKELEALQRVDATYLVPADSPELEAWKASMEVGEAGVVTESAAARRLAASDTLRAKYNKLVPDAVTHEHFWERYLFRVALLQDQLAAMARRSAPAVTADPVMARLPSPHTPTPLSSPENTQGNTSPEKTSPTVTESDSPFESPEDVDTVAWEDEDLGPDLELTEEQQILLLEEYEKELSTKKLSKQTSSRDISKNNTIDKTTNTLAAELAAKATVTNKPKQGRQVKKDPVKTTPPIKTAPNKTGPSSKTTPHAKTTSPNKSIDEKNNTVIGKNRDKSNNKMAKQSPKKGKTDDCGNNIVEDYFGDSNDKVKDDASANSDESWEKEFEIADVDQP